jgi:hypothetical protein
MDKSPKQLAEEHWAWIESILYQQRLMEKKLFIDAFVHGFKHGVEAQQGVKE